MSDDEFQARRGAQESESTIRTEIEGDDAYRNRLLLTKWGKNRTGAYLFTGAELDAIGREYDTLRIHNYICSPVPRIKA